MANCILSGKSINQAFLCEAVDTFVLFSIGEDTIVKGENYQLNITFKTRIKPIKLSYNDCQNTTDYIKCMRQEERAMLQKQGINGIRNHDSLILKAKNGKKTIFIDRGQDQYAEVFHLYKYIDNINYYIVKEESYETCDVKIFFNEMDGSTLRYTAEIFINDEVPKNMLISSWDGGINWCNSFLVFLHYDAKRKSLIEAWRIEFPIEWGVKNIQWLGPQKALCYVEHSIGDKNISKGMIIEF